ncbi:MAG: efflux RND transporter periplasmic adaptor subunit [Thermoguttaceae bacterium]
MNAALAERSKVTADLPVADPAPDAAPEVVVLPAGKARPRRGRRWLLALAVVAVGGGAAWHWYPQIVAQIKAVQGEAASGEAGKSSGKATLGFAAAADNGGEKKDALSPIATVPLEVVPCCDVLKLTGTLTADERSSVASNTSGIAAEVRVDRGDLVKKGDVLVQIDASDAKNKLAEGQATLDELKARLGLDGDMAKFNPYDEPEVRLAKASADLAASNFRRSKDLFDKKVISTEEFERSQTEYESAMQRYRQALFQIKQAFQVCKTAQIKLAILTKAVDDTTIRAPFSGFVAEKLVAVGEQISSGMQATKVLTLVRIDPLRLSLTVPQQDVGRIRPGQTVRFHVDSFPDRVFTARVRFIAPIVANDTRSMVAEAVADNPDAALRPGTFATAELELPNHRPSVLAPLAAVQWTGEVGKVFVAREGVAREQVVALGDILGNKIQIRSGLTGQEMLVANPARVHDGDALRQGPGVRD